MVLLAGLSLAWLPLTASAADANGNTLLPGAGHNDTFLPPDVAFRLAASAESPDRVRLSWAITPGYYLYQSRLKFATTSPGMTLGAPELPAGDTKNDEYFGKQVVYHNALIAHVPVAHAAGTRALTLSVTYQGCAEAGLCYPPITKQFDLTLPGTALAATGASADAGAGGTGSTNAGSPGAASAAPFVSEQDRLARMIRTGSLAAIIASFFGLGLLLAFTPCVLPMVPILSGLIAGQGANVTTQRAFLLSLTYVLGMAITYTVAGAAFAAAGHQVQAVFQQPWIILLFAALFIVLALSMFGLFTLQMPGVIQERLTSTSNRQRAGTFGGVAIMGALSALIVTACVAPALVGALLVIGQGGDVVRGAVALFSMSLGMGAPLLVIGTSAGKLLPRAGAWMDTVKQLFGAIMLGVAAWMLARFVGDRLSLLLYCVPLIAAVVVLWKSRARGPARALGRVVALGAGAYVVLLGVGFARGATDPLRPLAAPAAMQAAELPFARVSSVAELDRAVQAASASGRAVMLDFYADWCTSCKEMERYTFSNPQVHVELSQLTLLRADVTANNAEDQALLKRFGIFGPPTIAFYGKDGNERSNYRVVGYMKAAEFAQVVSRATQAGG
ncbi:MAG: protein-disulfide reductase DsbD [Steroidobacteraceae bacterium]